MVALAPVTYVQAQGAGLAERRAIAAYQETTFPAQLKAVQTAAGYAVPVEVKWDTLAVAGKADRYKEDGYATNIYFVPLTEALRRITVDEMGKKALKDKLANIVVLYDEATAPSSAYANGLKFEGGTLTINFAPDINADDIKPRAEAIQKLLESKL
ncbi:hypothetical protein RAS12_04150 [Achromobacter seleniivolatilans]|uniref:Uncharacterized protein n=1 Tax=Achromobacter seleniivolatilans TaxID=3047478 RepID=A0ABY9M3P8_9BURK|nr:hypothetical protein [Achromobacter sp. R39]WMD21575.1 hypothetical protein RAS12_04150 [Achromobacter sp. R39]